MPVNFSNNLKLEELLDSDDELPMEYNDISTTPAYEIDSRFDMIQFKWINYMKSPGININNTKTNSIASSNTDISFGNLENKSSEPITKKGVLNKYDLFCLKSIEGYTSDSTLIWLVNFLMYKDLQTSYEFLKSCLVSNTLCNDHYYTNKFELPSDNKNQCCTIIIKS